ncbi:MAG: polyprenyl diphosphate synthase [Termitinemataceae bacterium]|nr:MAG: polyprenyl diphosphate synthase [Termitinemataceae bacterium]
MIDDGAQHIYAHKKETLQNLPAHVGIIMDGNGRWAQCRGMARTQGHLEGLKAARKIVEAASNFGIRYLTLFVFSTENFKRSEMEIDFIMSLVKKHLMREIDFYKQNKLRIRHAGDTNGLRADIIAELKEAQTDTKDFTGMQVVLALNYGGRAEIIRAVKRIVKQQIDSGDFCSDNFDEDLISYNLDNPDIPAPDLIIRTAGEYRLSNFLLWQAAYSEIFISPVLWPDWSEECLFEALKDYAKRERRFGAVTK